MSHTENRCAAQDACEPEHRRGRSLKAVAQAWHSKDRTDGYHWVAGRHQDQISLLERLDNAGSGPCVLEADEGDRQRIGRA